MIKSITFLTNTAEKKISFSKESEVKVVIDCKELNSNSFDLKVIFDLPITSFRTHDYKWVALNEDRIATDFSSKIIQLQNGDFIQSNLNIGIWEVQKSNPKILLWRFNPEFSNPITKYSGKTNTKKIVAANSNVEFVENLAFLRTKNSPIELSRSPIPFSAIACFTDHCDYDTLENLQIQREFFNTINLKTTKGFFLNHFSKRADNASFQNNAEELILWRTDGHELCYHSLSQSIRNEEEAFEEFENFKPPFETIPVWIDHGFQPYNLTMFERGNFSNEKYAQLLSDKRIHILWNYIDAATSTTGVINQLNSSQFNLGKYYQSIKNMPFLKRMVLLFKNIIFHYDNDEFRVRNYIDSITYAKAILKKKKVFKTFALLRNVIPLLFLIIKVLFTWSKVKKATYKVAKYSPLFFSHKIDDKEFYIFQTIDMVDFKAALSKENINSLIQESGIFIAHTYFSVNMNHHEGKLLNLNNTLNENVVENFNYLSDKIKNKSIWNPTLSELLSFYKNYQATLFDIDEKGIIFIKNNFNIPSRSL